MFRRRPSPQAPVEWLIVGLGNPGGEYRGTRHNVGFDVIDRLGKEFKIKVDRSKHRALTGQGEIQGHGVMLAKPLTYMNLSGQSVGPLARMLGLKPDRVLVIADDLDLPTGKLRLRQEGSAGGHNGHKSIIAALQTQAYPRLKIGIGRSNDSTVDHVLSGFRPEEREVIEPALEASIRVVEAVVARSWEEALREIESSKQA